MRTSGEDDEFEPERDNNATWPHDAMERECNDNFACSQDAAEGEQEEEEYGSDGEEEDMQRFFDFEEAGPAPTARGDKIREWPELREQVKTDLQQKQNMTFTQKNQLMIIRNFATLRIKGFGRMAASEQIAQQWHEGEGVHFARQIRTLARHYQKFEQLPPEKRGSGGGRSLFNDEKVQLAARTHLMGLPTGSVTPTQFRRALNERILPSLGYMLEVGLSERTARRWLYKLGWRRTRLKKGVYMDGHERKDVKEYRENVFLPLMASFERRMVRWEFIESKLERIEPELEPGKQRIVPIFQDESSFHANEYKQNIWCAPK